MIDFARKSYFPSLSVSPWLRKHPRSIDDGQRFFELGIKTPQSTVAHLTTYGASLIRLLPTEDKQHLINAWLEVRAQALQTLREALESPDHPSTITVPLLQQCLYLFQGEVENRTFDAARIHAKTLRYLFQSQASSPSTIFLYLSAAHSSLETALFTFSAPILTFDSWQPEMWQSIWSGGEKVLMSMRPSTVSCIHLGIKPALIRESMMRLRLHFLLPTLKTSPDSPAEKALRDLTLLWSATRLVDDAMKLLKRFIDLSAASQFLVAQDLDGNNEPGNDALWNSVLFLTAFCNLRNHAQSHFLDDTDIDLRDASHVLAPRLKELLECLLVTMTPVQMRNRGEVLFWIFFTASMFEQRKGSIYHHGVLNRMRGDSIKKQKSPRGYWWFFERLREQAKILGLTKWDDARTLLDSFAGYGEGILEPDPAIWYEQVFE
jgi:hypothetical protein